MDLWLSRVLPLFLLGINLVLGLLVWKKSKEKPIRMMGLLSGYVFVYELAGHALGYRGISNLWLYNVANHIWVAGLCWYYYLLLSDQRFRKFTAVLFILYLLINMPLVFLYSFRSQGLNAPGIIVGSILVILLSLFFLYEENIKETSASIFSNPYYFFCIGLVFIHLLFIFMNGMYNFLLNYYKTGNMQLFLVYVPILGALLFNVLVSIGFVCYLRNLKSMQSLQAASSY